MFFGYLNFEGHHTVVITFMCFVLHVCNLKVGLETWFTIPVPRFVSKQSPSQKSSESLPWTSLQKLLWAVHPNSSYIVRSMPWLIHILVLNQRIFIWCWFIATWTSIGYLYACMQFPDVIHAMKPNPKSNVQEWWRIMDYLSYIPESTHMFFWWLDDWGVPSDYRHMDGYTVHTFKV